MFEVEAKARIINLETLKNNLKLKKAEFIESKHQKDHVYGFEEDFPPKDGGVIARIRESQGKIILELKEIDREKGGVELSYEIKDVESFHNFLLKLKFKKFFVTDKKRDVYKLGDFEICIDDVEGLGNFIEVEKIIDDESMKEKTMEECVNMLKELSPEAVLTKEKYGDMICKKLGIIKQ